MSLRYLVQYHESITTFAIKYMTPLSTRKPKTDGPLERHSIYSGLYVQLVLLGQVEKSKNVRRNLREKEEMIPA